MSFATPADVKARWPPGLPIMVDDAAIQVWLDDAELLIRANYNLSDLEPAETQVVAFVEARMVVRALTNPRGVRSESIGDTSVSYSESPFTLGLQPDDLALLDGLFGQTGNLFSIPVERADRGVEWGFEPGWLELEQP